MIFLDLLLFIAWYPISWHDPCGLCCIYIYRVEWWLNNLICEGKTKTKEVLFFFLFPCFGPWIITKKRFSWKSDMGKGRAPCCDKDKVKRGPWSPAEDLKLINFIQKHGHENWRALPKQAGQSLFSSSSSPSLSMSNLNMVIIPGSQRCSWLHA